MGTYCGTPATMAPEVARQEPYNQSADVFSFAIILWELLTRCEAYAGRDGLPLAYAVANDGLRPSLPAYCPLEWGSLMTAAWADDPADRPSFDAIQRELLRMIRIWEAPPPALGGVGGAGRAAEAGGSLAGRGTPVTAGGASAAAEGGGGAVGGAGSLPSAGPSYPQLAVALARRRNVMPLAPAAAPAPAPPSPAAALPLPAGLDAPPPLAVATTPLASPASADGDAGQWAAVGGSGWGLGSLT